MKRHILNSRESKTFQNEHAAATWSQDSVAVGRGPTVRAYESPPYAWTCGQCSKPIDHERFLCAECAIDNDRGFDRARQRVKAILLARWAEPAERLHAEYDQAQSVIQEHASRRVPTENQPSSNIETQPTIESITFREEKGLCPGCGVAHGEEHLADCELRAINEGLAKRGCLLMTDTAFANMKREHAYYANKEPVQCPACGSRTGDCEHQCKPT